MFDLVLLSIPTIIIVSSLVIMIPVIIGIITIKDWINTPLRIIFIYCLIYSVFESIAWYYVLNHLQNHFLFNLVIYFDILFWGYYFYSISTSFSIKKVIAVLVILTVSLTLWSHLATGRDFNRIDSFANSVSNLSLIAIAILFFYQLLNDVAIENLFIYPHFWISVGVLIYFSGVFFVHIFAEYITFSKDESITQFWITKDYLLFFQRIFLAIGLWFSKTPPQLSPSSK